MMTKISTKLFAAFAAILAAVLMFAGAASANVAEAKTLDASKAGIQVSDDITRLHVQKLDADTWEPLPGATLQVFAKDNPGVVIEEWTTDGTVHMTDKKLDVNVHYVLREISAPDGYAKVTDTEFWIDPTEGVGIHIVNGDDAELTQAYNINLYDKKQATEQVITVAKTSSNSSTWLPNTGDGSIFLLVGLGIALVTIAALSALTRLFKK